MPQSDAHVVGRLLRLGERGLPAAPESRLPLLSAAKNPKVSHTAMRHAESRCDREINVESLFSGAEGIRHASRRSQIACRVVTRRAIRF
jgi:hypothetical protein